MVSHGSNTNVLVKKLSGNDLVSRFSCFPYFVDKYACIYHGQSP